MKLTSLFCTSLLLLAASCGGDAGANATLDSGYTSLNSGNHAEALGHFETALGGLTPADEDYLGAKLGQLQAMSFIDAPKTKTTLLAIPTEAGVGPRDYRSIVDELTNSAEAQAKGGDKDKAGATMIVAAEILGEGKTKFPEYDGWDALLKKTGDKATALGSDDALNALTGLGYAGDD